MISWETIETVANLKNPRPVAYVQTNIAENIQVNNASQNAPSKLLEVESGEPLDTGTTGAAIGADPQLEAVGAVNGTKDSTG